MRRRPLLAVLVTCLTALGVTACGGSDGDGGGSPAKGGNATDAAFVTEMAAHHRTAIAMAKLARTRAEHADLKALAASIETSQTRENRALAHLGDELDALGVQAGTLGLSADAMGMDGDVAALRTADPFDKAFLAMMIPHHQGAIAMARKELADGENTSVRRVAQAVLDAQGPEIRRMQGWQEDWYGGAGGGMSMGSGHSAMGHGG